ncbi:hypothetical protein BH18ACT12_BH18ACT12_03140 [soil metagenome]
MRSRITETALARIGLAVVALHVADDSFFQPQPGTSATDHLAGGLFPIAVLVGVALVYPRLRGGLRALLAVTLGIFGVVTGIEAAYYVGEVGASGDDYTGFLAIPAGMVLIGTGVVTLWRTRRTDDRIVRRYGRRLLLAPRCSGSSSWLG